MEFVKNAQFEIITTINTFRGNPRLCLCVYNKRVSNVPMLCVECVRRVMHLECSRHVNLIDSQTAEMIE